MIEYQVNDTAAPSARLGSLSISGKDIDTPTYFPTMTRVSDPEQVTGAVEVLDGQGGPPLPNTGGFIVESHLAPTVLDGMDRSTQANLNGELQYTNFYSVIDLLDKCLIIDPNTDRLLYSKYRNNIGDIADHLPDEFLAVADALEADDDEEGSLRHEEAYPRLRETVSRPNLVENMLGLQAEYGPDLFLPPYYPIGLDSYEKDLEENVEMFRVANSLADRLYDRPVAAVLPVKKSILGVDADQANGQRQPPQVWLDIIHTYRELDTDLLFLKATNVDTDPDELHKTDSEGMFNFFRVFRRFTDMPTFFLGLDEFAYILMAQGLDGYSHPLYNSPYRKPMRPGNNNNASHHRRFIVPRKWGWEKFDQMDSLGCNGPFCEPYNDTDPSDIEFSDQDQLRRRHWLWLRDEELDQMYEAIVNDEVRPGLQSICQDSEWKKNFTKFL
jgi:hypothetical protein